MEEKLFARGQLIELAQNGLALSAMMAGYVFWLRLLLQTSSHHREAKEATTKKPGPFDFPTVGLRSWLTTTSFEMTVRIEWSINRRRTIKSKEKEKKRGLVVTPIAGPLTRETDLCVCRSDGARGELLHENKIQEARKWKVWPASQEGRRTAAPWFRLSSVQQAATARKRLVIRKRRNKNNRMKKKNRKKIDRTKRGKMSWSSHVNRRRETKRHDGQKTDTRSVEPSAINSGSFSTNCRQQTVESKQKQSKNRRAGETEKERERERERKKNGEKKKRKKEKRNDWEEGNISLSRFVASTKADRFTPSPHERLSIATGLHTKAK